MKKIMLDYGTAHMPVEVPDSAAWWCATARPTPIRRRSTRSGPHVPPSMLPLGMPPLTELAGPGRTARIIVFPDRVKGGAHPLAHRRCPSRHHRRPAPRRVPETRTSHCSAAQGLHRRNTHEEWLEYLGPEVIDRSRPNGSPITTRKARTCSTWGSMRWATRTQPPRHRGGGRRGDGGALSANPYGGFQWRLQDAGDGSRWPGLDRSRHNPATMHRADWLGGAIDSHMRHQFRYHRRSHRGRIGEHRVRGQRDAGAVRRGP